MNCCHPRILNHHEVTNTVLKCWLTVISTFLLLILQNYSFYFTGRKMDLRIFASNSNLRQIWCQICPPNKCRKCETNLLSHLSRRNVGQMCFKYAIMFALVQSFFFKTRQMWRVKNGKMPLFCHVFSWGISLQVLQPQMYCLWAPLKTIFQKL